MSESIRDSIHTLVSDALSQLGLSGDVVLEHPADTSHGDFSCNVAMVVAKKEGQNPKELAQKIVAALPTHEYIERVEVAEPGFINFHLSEAFFTQSVAYIETNKDAWGRGESKKEERVIIEYTDPNPFKELHIGHLVPNAIGESLSRLYEYAGAEVKRVTFQGDVGMHVAKAIWGLQDMDVTPGSTIDVKQLGEAYAKGAQAYEAGGAAVEGIKDINKKVYERSDDGINALYDAGKASSLAYFEEMYELLGSDFDHYFFESETAPIGRAVVEKHIGDVFEESEGAVVFKGEAHGLHTRVFINQEGIPTYEAKDIGLILAKKEWWDFDTTITVTGAEQASYFAVIQKAAELILPDMTGKVEIVANGMLKLTEGKMSSRTGDVISARTFLEELTQRITERMGEDVGTRTPQQVAVGAIRYAVLRSGTGKDILFDPKNSISLEGDTGPYLQYTYARARSVLEKAKTTDSADRAGVPITNVERLLYRFPSVVARSVAEREPHHVAHFLHEIASAFNSWYAEEQILDGSEQEAYKLALTSAVATTLENGLWALGIEAPEKM